MTAASSIKSAFKTFAKVFGGGLAGMVAYRTPGALSDTLESTPGSYPNDDNISFYGKTTPDYRESAVKAFEDSSPLIKEDLLKNGLKIKVGGTMGDIHPEDMDKFHVYNLGDSRFHENQLEGSHLADQHEIDLAQHYYSSWAPIDVRPLDNSALNQTAEQLRYSADLEHFGKSLPGLQGHPNFLGEITGKWVAASPDYAAHDLRHEIGHEIVDVQKVLEDKSFIDAYTKDLNGMDEATKHVENYFIQNFNVSDSSTYFKGPNEAYAGTRAALYDPKSINHDDQILKDFPHTATYVKELETHYDKYRLPLGEHNYDRHIDTSHIDTSHIDLSHSVLDDSSPQALPLDDLHQSPDNSMLALGDAQHAMDGFLHHDIGVLSHHATDIDHAADIASHVTAMHHDFSPSYLKMLILGQALLFGIWKSQEDFLGTNSQFVAFKIDNAKLAAKNFLTSDGLVGSSWKYIGRKAHEVTHRGDEERAFVTLGKSKMAEYGSRANVVKGRIFGLAKAVAEPVMIFAVGAAVAGTSTTLVPIAVGLGISAFGASKIDDVLDVTGKTRKVMETTANFLASAKEASERIIRLPTRVRKFIRIKDPSADGPNVR
jgi:hypothetical protein